MERQVVPQRHPVSRCYTIDVHSQRSLMHAVVACPIREVQEPAGLFYVRDNLPRQRRHVRPDRPPRFSGVTVVARTPENPLYVARRVRISRAESIRSLDGDELNADEYQGAAASPSRVSTVSWCVSHGGITGAKSATQGFCGTCDRVRGDRPVISYFRPIRCTSAAYRGSPRRGLNPGSRCK